MELNKQWLSRVASIGKSMIEDEGRLRDVAGYAVKAMYSNGDSNYVVYLLNGEVLPAFTRSSLARWFRKMGINIESPVPGTREYTVGLVLDKKKQAKVFEDIKTVPVLDLEVKDRAKREPKPLEGIAATRAQKAIEKLVSRLKTAEVPDVDAAMLINDAWTRNGPASAPTSCVFTQDGSKIELTTDDLTLVVEFLNKRWATIGQGGYTTALRVA